MFLETREEMKDVKRPVDMKEGGGGRKVDETEWGLGMTETTAARDIVARHNFLKVQPIASKNP